MTDSQPYEKRRGFFSKHKWTIVLGAVAGLIAAAAVYLLHVPNYQSQAKLLLRYVVNRSPVDKEGTVPGVGRTNDDLVATEVEILTSSDLAIDVAEKIGDKRKLATSKDDSKNADAVIAVTSGLEVTSRPGSNVILLSYKHTDPALATSVLEVLLREYFSKHLEIHRALGASQFIQQQVDGVKTRLHQTDDALRKLTEEIGIIASAQGMAGLVAVTAKAKEELRVSETELVEQRARVRAMEKAAAQASAEATRPGRDPDSGQPADLATEQIRLAVLEAKVEHLKTELHSLHERSEKLSGILPQIADLERSKAVEEDNYRKLGANLEQARMDQALSPSQMPNISIVEKPTSSRRVAGDRKKIALLLATGGLVLGLVLAAGSEYRSMVRRPFDSHSEHERS